MLLFQVACLELFLMRMRYGTRLTPYSLASSLSLSMLTRPHWTLCCCRVAAAISN